MGKKNGEKNGGNNKVAPAPAEKKDDVSVTAVYNIDCLCLGCTRKVESAVRDFDGVEEMETDCGANKLTVKGTNLDPTAIREKLEEKIKKKVELVSPQPKKDGGGGGKKKPEKKEEPKKPKELRDELHKETLQLARENLENEPPIMELRNQCRIFWTTELTAAQEKLNELERKKEETLKFHSPQSLLQRLQDAMNKTEEESENLHKQLLDRDVDLGTFVQKYKKLRTTYHRLALVHLSAKTSSIG